MRRSVERVKGKFICMEKQGIERERRREMEKKKL